MQSTTAQDSEQKEASEGLCETQCDEQGTAANAKDNISKQKQSQQKVLFSKKNYF